MLGAVVVTLLASGGAQTSDAALRSVSIGVFTKKAAPVEDLKAEEISVVEGGQKRAVLGVERDRRPLEVALILDSSAAVASVYRSDLVGAAIDFWKALPPEARIAVWTSGPPSKVVDFGMDLAAGEPRLKQVASAGKNYVLEAIVDASKDLGTRSAERRTLVAVTYTDVEANRMRSAEALEALGLARTTPMIILVEGGAANAPMGGPTGGIVTGWDMQSFFQRMAEGYGGSYSAVLTTLAASKMLRQVAADLTAQYRVRYESTAGATGRPEVEVKRKDVKVRVGRTQVERLALKTN